VDRFDSKLDYVKHSGPDDFISEGTGYRQGQTFPHPFQLGITKDAAKNNKILWTPSLARRWAMRCCCNSPDGDRRGKLGPGRHRRSLVHQLFLQRSHRPLLGPRFARVLDVTLRSRRPHKEPARLSRRQGRQGNYYFALSADHGVCPLPEFAKGKPAYLDQATLVKDAERVEPEILTTQAELFLNGKFLPAGQKAPWAGAAEEKAIRGSTSITQRSRN